MNASLIKFVSNLLMFSMMFLSISQASAAMIGTDQVIAPTHVQINRDALINMVNRADVSQQLQAMGISPENAVARVNALTNEEVQRIAGKLENLPAGASGWAWGAAIIVAALVWWFYLK
jgi:hypothetical protein